MSFIASSEQQANSPSRSLTLAASARCIGDDGSRYSLATAIPHHGLPWVTCLAICLSLGIVRFISMHVAGRMPCL